MTKNKALQWLYNETDFNNEYIIEEISEEMKEFRDITTKFVEQEISPIENRLEGKEEGLMRQVMEKAGNLGLLGVSIPEKYNGSGKNLLYNSIVGEAIGKGYGSFTVSFSAHTSIGTNPILLFGTPEQIEKYIPKLASGEYIGAYGLTEPGSGSDALSGKTTAVLSPDGKHYILNGQKCWITNGGFADIFTVFAKIDGVHFTSFIVEKGIAGFTHGVEEHKLGIKGSSTVQLYFQDCKIPKENVLGEIGQGHKIAFNILNSGRVKLGVGCLGAAKKGLLTALEYAQNRIQFKQPIANFGAIKQKFSDMLIHIWLLESISYRTVGNIEEAHRLFEAEGKNFAEAELAAFEAFATECSIVKVFGSETLHNVLDECLQIHGGNGFSDEYLISRAFRDQRINRIFEGTNEINRLLVLDMILKRALSGKIELLPAIKKVQKDLLDIPDFQQSPNFDNGFEYLPQYLANFKKLMLIVAGAAAQKFEQKLAQEQELILCIVQIIMDVYICESGLVRLQKLNSKGKNTTIQMAMLQTFFYDQSFKIAKAAQDAITYFSEGDEQKMLLLATKRFTKTHFVNTIALRKEIVSDFYEKKTV